MGNEIMSITNRSLLACLLAGAWITTATGCGEDPPSEMQSNAVQCIPGLPDNCACPDSTMRVTTCNAEGNGFAACPCSTPLAGSGGMSAGTQALPTAGMTALPTGGVGATGGSAGVAGTSGGIGGASGAAGMAGMAGTTGGASGAAGTAGTMAEPDAGNSDDEFAAERKLCVDTINMYRETLGRAPLAQATPEQEMCSDRGAKTDADNNAPHSSAGSCDGLGAQDTCPGWGVGGFSGNATVGDALKNCLAAMWAEGEPPVSREECIDDYQGCFLHYGHYLNMSDPNATVVSCGFYAMPNNEYWMNQDFGWGRR